MAETRKYTRSGRRNIISANEILAKVGQYALICVPIAAVEIARKAIMFRGYWPTSYASSYDDAFYTLPSATEMDTISEFLDEFMEATTNMDCNDLINELDDIGNAITALGASGGCGCGSGGAGATSPADEPEDTGDITLPTGTPPDGYPDWETYQVAKCNIATFIVQNLLDDVRWWQTVQLATMTLAGLSAGMVSILSAFTLTAILAGLLAILAYELTMLSDAEDQLVTGFDDLVCAILAGTDSASSQANFIGEMTTQMEAAITDPISEFLVIQLLSVWVDTTSFNLLYEDYDTFLGHQIPGGADCSTCGLGCSNEVVQEGNWLGGQTYEGVWSAAAYRVSIYWNVDLAGCNDFCGPMERFKMVDLTGWTDAASGNDNFRIWADGDCPFGSDNASVYSSDTPIPIGVEYCGRLIAIQSATPFTVTFERLGHCF